MFSEKVAVGSAWAWALLPNVMFWCTRASLGDELVGTVVGYDFLAGPDS